MLSTSIMFILYAVLQLLILPVAAVRSSVVSNRATALAKRHPSGSYNGIPYKTVFQDVHGEDVNLPLLGAGTWQYNDTEAYQSVCHALQAGYTMIDTAWGYHNQKGVGRAIRDCYQGARSNLFVLTKVPGGLTYNQTLAAHQDNLWQLQLDHVDHLMVHYPSDWQQTHTGKQQRQEQWRALQLLYRQGKARSLGISHYCSRHIQDVLEIAEIRPCINQVEYHVGSGDVDNVKITSHHEEILFMSFSPLCGPCQLTDPNDSLVTGKLVTDIGLHYNKTGPQVALRFIVQQADEDWIMAGVIPKSNNPKHILENRNIFDFELSLEDMNRLQDARQPKAEPGDCNVP
jgi:diketogulonate reductase-like aldo/keto reductase